MIGSFVTYDDDKGSEGGEAAEVEAEVVVEGEAEEGAGGSERGRRTAAEPSAPSRSMKVMRADWSERRHRRSKETR